MKKFVFFLLAMMSVASCTTLEKFDFTSISTGITIYTPFMEEIGMHPIDINYYSTLNGWTDLKAMLQKSKSRKTCVEIDGFLQPGEVTWSTENGAALLVTEGRRYRILGYSPGYADYDATKLRDFEADEMYTVRVIFQDKSTCNNSGGSGKKFGFGKKKSAVAAAPATAPLGPSGATTESVCVKFFGGERNVTATLLVQGSIAKISIESGAYKGRSFTVENFSRENFNFTKEDIMVAFKLMDCLP